MAVRREQVVKTAEKLVARGKIEAAIKEYRKVLGDTPNDTNTLNRVGDLYARIERIDDAVKLFTQIAEGYTEDGFFVKAIAIYKKINKLDPTRLEVYEKLAELYHRQGLVNEARSQYQVLAEYYLKHGNHASALSIYERMVALEPDDPSHRAKLAELYQEQRLTDKAMAQYGSIAELMVEHGRPDEAVKVYERGFDLDKSDLDFIADAVAGLRRAGANAAAARLLAAAVEKNPEAASIERLADARAGAAAEVAEAPAEEAPPPPPEAPAEAVESAAPPVAAIPVEPAAEPAAEPEVGEPPAADDEDADLVLDLDLAQELDKVPFAAPEGPAAAPPPPLEAPADGAAAPSESGEYELDLDDSFVLDLEEDAEPPASQVQPPPDMAGAAPNELLRAEASETAAPPAPPAPEPPPDVEPPRLDEDVFVLDEPATEVAAADAAPPAAPPLPAEPGAPTIDPDFLERTAAELLPPERQAEDLLTEAEVLAKYGLEEKAAERLQEVLRLAPGHVEAMALLVRLDLQHGQHGRVLSVANQLARIAVESGDDRAWRKVRRRLEQAGYRLDGDRVTGAPPAAGGTEQAVGRMLEGLLEEPAAADKRPGRARGEAQVEAALAELEAEVRVPKAPPAAEAPPPTEEPPAAEPPPLEELPPFEEMPPLEEMPTLEEMPPAADVAAEAPPAAEAAPSEEPVPAAEEPLEDSGTQWLAQVEAATSAAGAGVGDAALDEEEDFFDLAAEIEQELDAEEAASEEMLEPPREQSLEEIVEGFKQGVAESLSSEDYDTHFNLGIAYREMGLLDEAIGEFQLAAKDPARLTECCSMLGLCFLEKGLPELAVKWYQRGLETPGLTEDDQLGLMYDLGNVYLAIGDLDQARSVYVEIYGTNSNYRDIVAKLEEVAAHQER